MSCGEGTHPVLGCLESTLQQMYSDHVRVQELNSTQNLCGKKIKRSWTERSYVMRQNGQSNTLPKWKENHEFHREELGSARERNAMRECDMWEQKKDVEEGTLVFLAAAPESQGYKTWRERTLSNVKVDVLQACMCVGVCIATSRYWSNELQYMATVTETKLMPDM